jgi:hypothetical protein
VAETVVNKTGPLDRQGVIQLEGYLKSAADPDFELVSAVGPLVFRVQAQTTYTNGVADDLVQGARLEVEGYYENDILIAESIIFNSALRLQAAVASADAGSGAVTLVNLSGLTVYTDAQTRFKDHRRTGAKKPVFPDVLDTLTNLETLTIKGRLDQDHRLLATEVKIDDGPDTSGNVILRGPVTRTPSNWITFDLLDISISTDDATSFEGANGAHLSRNDFFLQLTRGRAVQIKGLSTADNAIAATVASLED